MSNLDSLLSWIGNVKGQSPNQTPNQTPNQSRNDDAHPWALPADCDGSGRFYAAAQQRSLDWSQLQGLRYDGQPALVQRHDAMVAVSRDQLTALGARCPSCGSKALKVQHADGNGDTYVCTSRCGATGFRPLMGSV